jgi:enediyne biosynthesis protein E4
MATDQRHKCSDTVEGFMIADLGIWCVITVTFLGAFLSNVAFAVEPMRVDTCVVANYNTTKPGPSKASCRPFKVAACTAGGPRIVAHTSRLAPGPDTYIHVRTDRPADAVEVRIQGRITNPMYVDEPALGALYPVETTSGCPVEVAVRAAGERRFSACVSIPVEQGLFITQSTGVLAAIVHDGEDLDAEEFPVSTGLAVADYDGDGAADVYVANFALPGQLLRNGGQDENGFPLFTDVTVSSGTDGVFRGTAANFADIDGDGDLDLYVGRDGRDALFLNQLIPTGTATFLMGTEHWNVNVTADGSVAAQRTTGVTFGDFDGDGRPDLYLSTHVSNMHDGPEMARDRLYWNAGDKFVEVTNLLGDVQSTLRASFAALWVDIDDDGDTDLVVSSDHDPYAGLGYSKPGTIWRNDGPGNGADDGRQWRFTNVGKQTGFAIYPDAKAQGLNAMGMDYGDVNGDGTPELAMSNIGPNVLLAVSSKPDGLPLLTDTAGPAGVQRTYLPWQPATSGDERRGAWQDMSVTWGTHLFDGDNDGDIDLFFAGASPPSGQSTNSMFGRRPIPNAWFENDATGHFVERTNESGLADPLAGIGTAVGDLNGDGWLDLIVATYRGPLRIYKNTGARKWPERNAYIVELRSDANGTHALGARAYLTDDSGRRQRCDYIQKPGNSGGTGPWCHFGTGRSKATVLDILWPDGSTFRWDGLPGEGARITCSRAALRE